MKKILLYLSFFIVLSFGSQISCMHELFQPWKGNLERIKQLIINKELDVNESDKDSHYSSSRDTPLCWAIFYKNHEAAKLLLENGADINKTDRYGYTPLHIACGRGRVDSVKFLLDNGADPNIASDLGDETPLNVACREGYFDIARCLLNRKADPQGAWRLLYHACVFPDVSMVKFLVENGIDPNKTDRWGRSPLYFACNGCVKLKNRHWLYGDCPLYCCQSLPLVKLLVEKGKAKIGKKVIEKIDDYCDNVRKYLINHTGVDEQHAKADGVERKNKKSYENKTIKGLQKHDLRKLDITMMFEHFYTDFEEKTLKNDENLASFYERKSNVRNLIKKTKENIQELKEKDIDEIKKTFNRICLGLQDVYHATFVTGRHTTMTYTLYDSFKRIMKKFDQD